MKLQYQLSGTENDTQSHPSIDTVILKASLMAEWTTEKEFDRQSTAQVDDTINVQVNNQVNVPNLSILFGVSKKTIKRDIYVLRDMNLIHYVGSDKTGHWEIVDRML